MTKVTSLTFVMTHEDCHLARNFITKFLETNERLKQLIIWNLITDVSHSALRKLPHVDMYRLFHFVTQLLVASGVRGEMVGSSWTAEYQSRQVSRKADAWAWQAYQGNNLKIEGNILQDGGACSESVGRSGFGKFESKFDLGGELSDGLTWWKRYREFSTICKSKHRDIFELRGFDGVTEYNESFHRLIEADSGFGR
ncbi:hypothetical protein B0O99DRAFT_616789 [Bisporella sp. PMI_857]|nr:hypothetical protein B0O99DRAFT_616789 [Bisporella sp. PMI_857]